MPSALQLSAFLISRQLFFGVADVTVPMVFPSTTNPDAVAESLGSLMSPMGFQSASAGKLPATLAILVIGEMPATWRKPDDLVFQADVPRVTSAAHASISR